ncbi:MAG: DUF503 domain-containing protein [candidate division KSB1 bacterium]|nr:DUF503 domain-containing protein [candidate division KSB1 bacterium]MDZ7275482.1 DUF503 domain-containing protein [candidate division KSB1 bacterium]MDZ7286206.1 DUF503 domain-containing protein [candidate division KSB1 bacterium]MDZ7296432.1 DUF503 domain-containing protein [candidate division KSB1 bacterium]MDZ7309277.1 DUF503 domain-containing protein [candidate division KSB1 bacterium]
MASPMFVGVCQIEIMLPESDSLKAKRFVLSSIKTKIQNKFNVSVAEVGNNDLWQRGVLGLAMVTNEHKFIDQTFNKILELLYQEDRVEVLGHTVDIY